MMKRTIYNKAILGLCTVSLCFVVLSIGVRWMNEGFGPFTQVYLRIGGAFILAVAIYYKKIRFTNFKKIPRRDWLLLMIMGTVGYGIAIMFVTLGVLNTTLLNVAIIGSTVPFFALLYLFIITRKPIKAILLLFLFISFIGVYLITTKSFSLVIHSFGIGEVYALLFAAGSGAFVVSRGFISNKLSNTEITVIVIFIAFVSSFLGAMLMGEKLAVSGFTNPLAMLGLITGIILNIIATQLQNFGFEHVNPVTGSQLLLLQNIFAPILGIIFYNETVLPIEFLGAAFILFGVIGYYRRAGS
jgi:drug/metabolite transporter (DMT)-like permease